MVIAVVDEDTGEAMPEPAFSLHHAFDAGEWIRHDDPPEIDAGEKYTRPVVVAIMRNLEGESSN